jgi:hypothetical protein
MPKALALALVLFSVLSSVSVGYTVGARETASLYADKAELQAAVSKMLHVEGTTTFDCKFISWTP